jgi:hypothetical protein
MKEMFLQHYWWILWAKSYSRFNCLWGNSCEYKSSWFYQCTGIYSAAQTEGMETVTKAVHEKEELYRTIVAHRSICRIRIYITVNCHTHLQRWTLQKRNNEWWFCRYSCSKRMTIEDIKQKTVLDFKNGAKMRLQPVLMESNCTLPMVFVATVFNGYSNHRWMNTVVLLKNKSHLIF